MDKILELVLQTYGIVGILILAPFIATIFLWRGNEKLHKDIKDLQESHKEELKEANSKVIEAHALRTSDAQAISKKIVEIVAEQTSLNKETNHAIERVGDMLSVLIERR